MNTRGSHIEPEAQWIVEDNKLLKPDEILALGWHEVKAWEAHPDYRDVGEKGITDWITHDVGILTLKEPVSLDRICSDCLNQAS